jgi:hypothetical protein
MLPAPEIARAATLGFINTPPDNDEVVRRLRSYVAAGDQVYYSFTVQAAAALMKEDPAKIIAALPLLKDKSFPVNFLVKPGDGHEAPKLRLNLGGGNPRTFHRFSTAIAQPRCASPGRRP